MLEFGTENEEVNEYSSLAPFVISIDDGPDNSLRIVIALPKNIPVTEDILTDINIPKLKDILSDASQVIEDEERLYEIRFESYILYQCRNESYAMSHPSDVVKGRHLVILENSLLLGYCKDAVLDIDLDSYPEKSQRRHYGIYAENHTLDVISYEPPIIQRLDPDDVRREQIS